MVTAPVHSAPLDLVTTAVLELLRGTGRTVYDGAYAGDPTSPTYPYGVLYRIPGGSSDATPDLAMTRQSVTVAFQVTAVSSLRNQCEATTRLFRDRLMARDIGGWVHELTLPPGWACTNRSPDPTMPGVDRSGDPPRAIYSCPLRFQLTVTPT